MLSDLMVELDENENLGASHVNAAALVCLPFC
jgi:hypothetical protein